MEVTKDSHSILHTASLVCEVTWLRMRAMRQADGTQARHQQRATDRMRNPEQMAKCWKQ